MLIFQAIILGVIEGLTEFLPISSTGHLVVAEKYMSFHDSAKIFTVVIQVGATLAVVWYYRKDIWSKLTGFVAKEKNVQKFFANLLIAMIPAGLLGLAFDKKFETYARPAVTAVALIIGGAVLWLVDKKESGLHQPEAKVDFDKITPKQALGVGLMQIFALIPGVSRSGSSIVGGLLGGLNRVTATAFSFYVGMPLLIMASGYKLVKDRHELATISGGSTSIVLGTVASFIVGLLAVSWLLKYVSTHNFKLFAYYRIIFGIVVLLFIA